MINAETISVISAGVALTLVVACLVMDLAYRRIPNYLTFPAILIGLLLAAVGGGWNGLLISVMGILVGFGLMFLPYYLGGMGAGDVKLMVAVGALAGFPAIVNVFLYTALAGGMIALIVILRRGIAVKALKNAFAMLLSFILLRAGGVKSQAGEVQPKKSVGSIPYGVAIAVGTIAYYYLGNIL